MSSDRQYAHYLERDWLVWQCEYCDNALDEDGECCFGCGENEEDDE